VSKQIFSALNAADVKYLVVDGLAVNAYGYERLMRDVAFGTRPQNLADIAELEKIEKLKQSGLRSDQKRTVRASWMGVLHF
jgi:hypothetical protein